MKVNYCICLIKKKLHVLSLVSDPSEHGGTYKEHTHIYKLILYLYVQHRTEKLAAVWFDKYGAIGKFFCPKLNIKLLQC